MELVLMYALCCGCFLYNFLAMDLDETTKRIRRKRRKEK
jgi:hypothetical protein